MINVIWRFGIIGSSATIVAYTSELTVKTWSVLVGIQRLAVPVDQWATHQSSLPTDFRHSGWRTCFYTRILMSSAD